MNTLYTRLLGALLTLLLAIGGLFYAVSVYNARIHRLEVTQKLHLGLAESLVKESMLMSGGMIYAEAVEDVFHTLMVINPAIEVYLVDHEGALLRYSAPQGKVKLGRIALEPVERFLSSDTELPIIGDDPRHPGRQKVFSAAPIIERGDIQGYLYVILESEEYASAADGVWNSSALRLSMSALLATLVFALSAGGLLFYFLTRRLRTLDASVEEFCDGGFESPLPRDPVGQKRPRDEIDRLRASFEEMSTRIVAQVQELKSTDSQRRQLIANVSHDLRTPLAALKGYLDTLLLKGEELTPQERRQYLEIASNSSVRLERLIEDLFELAKLESVHSDLLVEPFSLPELVHDVLKKFELEAKGKGVMLEVEIANEVNFVTAEIGLIERVLENLLDNALRFTASGGRVAVRMSQHDGRIEIAISDTGAGIPAVDLPHVFERFYRAKHDSPEQEGGTGLGLAITKRILDLHGSPIEAESRIGRGTRFSFALPASESLGSELRF